MKVSKAQAEASRQAVIDAAGRLLRERGLDGVAVGELMQAAGLTHGGFYKKFGSRGDLVRQSTERALAAGQQKLTHRVANARGDPLAALVRGYLSPEHRDAAGEGCAFAALGPEVARSDDPALRSIFAEGLEDLVALIEGVIAAEPGEEARDRALAILSTMVGALILSRVADDAALSDRILAAATRSLLDRDGD